MTNLATTQVNIQGYELSQPNIYFIFELLGHMKGASLADLKFQDLHNRGQQDIRGGFGEVVEARGLKPENDSQQRTLFADFSGYRRQRSLTSD